MGVTQVVGIMEIYAWSFKLKPKQETKNMLSPLLCLKNLRAEHYTILLVWVF